MSCSMVLFIEQFCDAPKNYTTAHPLYIYDNSTGDMRVANSSYVLLVHQSYVSYHCSDDLVHSNGSLNGSCTCTSYTDDGSCATKPEWNFEEGLPECKFGCCQGIPLSLTISLEQKLQNFNISTVCK